MNIDGENIVVRVQRSRARANPNRHVVHVGRATFYFDTLDPQEAIEKAVAKYRALRRETGPGGYIDLSAAEQARFEAWPKAADRKVTPPQDDHRGGWMPKLGAGYGGEGPGTRHCSVAYSGDSVAVLRDVLKDNLSPQAVAVIAGHLHGMVNTKSDSVNREVAWFTEQLLDMVGDQYNALCEEAGL
jgi:hypothetical protein